MTNTKYNKIKELLTNVQHSLANSSSYTKDNALFSSVDYLSEAVELLVDHLYASEYDKTEDSND